MANYYKNQWLNFGSNICHSVMNTHNSGMSEIDMNEFIMCESYPKLNSTEEQRRRKFEGPLNEELELLELKERPLTIPEADEGTSENKGASEPTGILEEKVPSVPQSTEEPHKMIITEKVQVHNEDQKAAEVHLTEDNQPPATETLSIFDQIGSRVNKPYFHYMEYAKFDASEHYRKRSKTYNIFMTMAPESVQNYPVAITIDGNATIRDLIGLTCYKFNIIHPEIYLGSPFKYGLCIADDDGEIDWMFPCLGYTQLCYQIGFDYLALVDLELKKERTGEPAELIRHIDSSDGEEFSERHNRSTLSDSKDKLNAVTVAGDGFRLNLDIIQLSRLSANSGAGQVFQVVLCHKFWFNTKIKLRVTLDEIELEPVFGVWGRMFRKLKVSSHGMESIAWCETLGTSRGLTRFRITYNTRKWPSDRLPYEEAKCFKTGSYLKEYVFQCEAELGLMISSKISNLLRMCNSICYKDYVTVKESKMKEKLKRRRVTFRDGVVTFPVEDYLLRF